jgi:transcriptional regulator with XRE-family HTH domain
MMKGLELVLKLNDMSLKELGDKLGMSRSNVSMWVTGERKVPKKYLPILSEMFNVDIDYLTKEVTLVDGLRIQSKQYLKQWNETKDEKFYVEAYVANIEAEVMEVKDEIENIFTVTKNDDREMYDIEDAAKIFKYIIKIIKSKRMKVGTLRDLAEVMSNYPKFTVFKDIIDDTDEFEQVNEMQVKEMNVVNFEFVNLILRKDSLPDSNIFTVNTYAETDYKVPVVNNQGQ